MTSISTDPQAAPRRHYRCRRGRAWHRLAARRPRRGVAVRPRQGRRRFEPCRGRHAGGVPARPSPARRSWSRSAATARRAGRALPRSFLRASGVDVELRTRGHAGSGADRGRSGDADASSGFSDASSVCRSNGCRAAANASARSRILPARSRAPCSARKIIRSTIASSSRRCASPPKRAGATIHEHRPVKEIAVSRRPRRPASSWKTARASRPIASCSPPAPGRAALPDCRRIAGRRCARSKARCWRCAWMPNAPLLNHVLWAPGAYLVPRRDGRLIVGATVEEKGFDETVTAGGLLTFARSRVARHSRDRGIAGR